MKFATSSVYSLTPDFSSSISSSSIIVFIVSLFMGFLPFHCLQFFSILPQYSWSYRLSDHLYSFFAVNLPGSSPHQKVPSLRSCRTTSSISRRYSFSNSSIASFAFFKFSLPSQVSDFTVNPFQHTKYLSLSYDGKYPFNNIIFFLFYIITNFSILNSCCLLL